MHWPWHLSPSQWSFKQSEGDEETLHSSWSIYKKGIRENELDVVGKSDLQTSAKEKKHRQGMQLPQTRRDEALRKAEGITYEARGF